MRGKKYSGNTSTENSVLDLIMILDENMEGKVIEVNRKNDSVICGESNIRG